MKNYLREIRKHSILIREEERHYLVRAKEGDESARDMIINSNLRFVVSVAKTYVNQGLSMEDLVGEGNYGLIQALDRFDLTYKNKFITYAVWWIRHYIFQAISAANSGAVRLPTNKQQMIAKVSKTKERLEQKLHRPPTQEEIEEELGISVTGLINSSHNYLSLDASYLDEGGAPLQEVLPDTKYDPGQLTMDSDLIEDIKNLIDSLPTERERTILKYYYGVGMTRTHTLEEIGSLYNISRERVRQIKEKAMSRIDNSSKYHYLKQHLEE